MREQKREYLNILVENRQKTVDFSRAVSIFSLIIEVWRMGILKPNPKDKKNNDLRQYSLLAVVPTILIAGPGVGFFVGQWLDKKFDTNPLFLIIGIILGFGAAGLEIAKLVKRAESIDKEKNGTD